ncbi:hypothetical protein A3Q56_02598 [Intoshia linei]|uniref:Protein VAC14 homolog n=1 Tax=Intoshia linei TaxID=1819745 RepID=A0A177B5X0_9BILA|nr:hypothetical protein A3Q56_02598 [Intoshia linei]
MDVIFDKIYPFLNDKSLEKQKIGSDMLKRCIQSVAMNDVDQICKLEKFLNRSSDYIYSIKTCNKKVGLICCSTFANSTGKLYINNHKAVRKILYEAVLISLGDTDSMVRFLGSETLFNIMKVDEIGAIIYLENIFESIFNLSNDSDLMVEQSSRFLDSTLKSIIAQQPNYNYEKIFRLIICRIYSKDYKSKCCILNWIITLDGLVNFNTYVYLPQFLDGIMKMLEKGPQDSFKISVENFLSNLINNFDKSCVKMKPIFNIIILHCQNDDESIQNIAFTWLNKLTVIYDDDMRCCLSPILSCLYNENVIENLRNNHDLMVHINVLFETIKKWITVEKNIVGLDVESTCSIIFRYLNQSKKFFISESIELIYCMVMKFLDEYCKMNIDYIDPILKLLNSKNQKVQKGAVAVLAQISKHDGCCNSNVFINCINYYKSKEIFLKTCRLDFIIIFKFYQYFESISCKRETILCILRYFASYMTADVVYMYLCKVVLMVQSNDLRNVKTEQDKSFYCINYELENNKVKNKNISFIEKFNLPDENDCMGIINALLIQPMSLLYVFMGSGYYTFCFELVLIIGQLDEIPLDVLLDLENLVQILQMNSCSKIRLDLLNVDKSRDIIKLLHAILLIIPQSKSSLKLQKLLETVTHTVNIDQIEKITLKNPPKIGQKRYIVNIVTSTILKKFKNYYQN